MKLKEDLFKIILAGLFIGAGNLLIAQEKESPTGFKSEAKLDKINYSGFHKIVLSPELVGQLRSNKTDIRIFDESNKQIPYLLDQEQAVEYTRLFEEYEITETHLVKDDISYLIFRNPNRDSINNVCFVVRNTDVRKRARLSGSDDQENWYVIKNDYLLHSMYSTTETTELNILNFPLSNYEYFKLEINDYWKLPINIEKVGYYNYKSQTGKRQEFEPDFIEQKDSNKVTYLTIRFPEERYIENLRFDVEGADYYLREGMVQIEESYLNKRNEKVFYRQNIKGFKLNSNTINEFSPNLNNRKVKELYFEIQNNDDQPLKIKKVTASFLKYYLVTNLNTQSNYVLRFNDKNAEIPSYDLTYFQNNIPKDIATVQHGPIQSLEKQKAAQDEESGLFSNPYLLWGTLGGVGVILALVSMKMVKEIGRKEE